MSCKEIQVRGLKVDSQTRCVHYHSPLDIIAIKMKCCGVYYACKDCHRALETHEIETWPRREWDERAILCGNCRELLTIREYLGCESRCPRCAASFNAKCENHHHFYFETPRR